MRNALIVAALALATLPAVAAGGEPQKSGVEGRVFDITCYGPCHPDIDPRPFDGKAVVRVKSLPERKRVAEVPVDDSTFRVPLDSGLYRVRVVPYPGHPEPDCWRGSRRRASVDPGEFTRVRLTVENVCIR